MEFNRGKSYRVAQGTNPVAASARCDGAVSAGYKPRDKKEKQDKNKSSFRSQSRINLCKSQRDDAVG